MHLKGFSVLWGVAVAKPDCSCLHLLFNHHNRASTGKLTFKCSFVITTTSVQGQDSALKVVLLSLRMLLSS
jgi:hypothetical protein